MESFLKRASGARFAVGLAVSTSLITAQCRRSPCRLDNAPCIQRIRRLMLAPMSESAIEQSAAAIVGARIATLTLGSDGDTRRIALFESKRNSSEHIAVLHGFEDRAPEEMLFKLEECLPIVVAATDDGRRSLSERYLWTFDNHALFHRDAAGRLQLFPTPDDWGQFRALVHVSDTGGEDDVGWMTIMGAAENEQAMAEFISREGSHLATSLAGPNHFARFFTQFSGSKLTVERYEGPGQCLLALDVRYPRIPDGESWALLRTLADYEDLSWPDDMPIDAYGAVRPFLHYGAWFNVYDGSPISDGRRFVGASARADWKDAPPEPVNSICDLVLCDDGDLSNEVAAALAHPFDVRVHFEIAALAVTRCNFVSPAVKRGCYEAILAASLDDNFAELQNQVRGWLSKMD